MEEVKKKTRVTIADTQEINRLYDSGLNCEEVAKKVGWSQATVGKYIWNPRNRGTSFKSDGRKPKVTEANTETIKRMWYDGYSVREIAKEIGFSKNTVRRYLKKQEIREDEEECI